MCWVPAAACGRCWPSRRDGEPSPWPKPPRRCQLLFALVRVRSFSFAFVALVAARAKSWQMSPPSPPSIFYPCLRTLGACIWMRHLTSNGEGRCAPASLPGLTASAISAAVTISYGPALTTTPRVCGAC